MRKRKIEKHFVPSLFFIRIPLAIVLNYEILLPVDDGYFVAQRPRARSKDLIVEVFTMRIRLLQCRRHSFAVEEESSSAIKLSIGGSNVRALRWLPDRSGAKCSGSECTAGEGNKCKRYRNPCIGRRRRSAIAKADFCISRNGLPHRIDRLHRRT